MSRYSVPREDLVNDIKRIYQETGSIPGKNSYHKLGKYSGGTYQRMWGSWNNAMQEILGISNKRLIREKKEIECPVCKNVFMQKHCVQKFCSKKCSLEYVNKINPTVYQRKKTKKCKTCDTLILSSRIYCAECRKKGLHLDGGFLAEKTLKDIEYNRGSNRYGVIRQHAQFVFKNEKKICKICGYDKHAEICHKKPIKDFDKEAKLNEINSLDNLILLCPNCHWEFDHGLIKI